MMTTMSSMVVVIVRIYIHLTITYSLGPRQRAHDSPKIHTINISFDRVAETMAEFVSHLAQALFSIDYAIVSYLDSFSCILSLSPPFTHSLARSYIRSLAGSCYTYFSLSPPSPNRIFRAHHILHMHYFTVKRILTMDIQANGILRYTGTVFILQFTCVVAHIGA